MISILSSIVFTDATRVVPQSEDPRSANGIVRLRATQIIIFLFQ